MNDEAYESAEIFKPIWFLYFVSILKNYYKFQNTKWVNLIYGKQLNYTKKKYGILKIIRPNHSHPPVPLFTLNNYIK